MDERCGKLYKSLTCRQQLRLELVSLGGMRKPRVLPGCTEGHARCAIFTSAEPLKRENPAAKHGFQTSAKRNCSPHSQIQQLPSAPADPVRGAGLRFGTLLRSSSRWNLPQRKGAFELGSSVFSLPTVHAAPAKSFRLHLTPAASPDGVFSEPHLLLGELWQFD